MIALPAYDCALKVLKRPGVDLSSVRTQQELQLLASLVHMYATMLLSIGNTAISYPPQFKTAPNTALPVPQLLS